MLSPLLRHIPVPALLLLIAPARLLGAEPQIAVTSRHRLETAALAWRSTPLPAGKYTVVSAPPGFHLETVVIEARVRWAETESKSKSATAEVELSPRSGKREPVLGRLTISGAYLGTPYSRLEIEVTRRDREPESHCVDRVLCLVKDDDGLRVLHQKAELPLPALTSDPLAVPAAKFAGTIVTVETVDRLSRKYIKQGVPDQAMEADFTLPGSSLRVVTVGFTLESDLLTRGRKENLAPGDLVLATPQGRRISPIAILPLPDAAGLPDGPSFRCNYDSTTKTWKGEARLVFPDSRDLDGAQTALIAGPFEN